MRFLRGLSLLSVLVCVAIAMVGCGADADNVGGERRPQTVRKIISLSPSTTELIGSVAGYEYLVGRTSACNFPSMIMQAEVVAGVKPDYDKIAKLQPEAIVLDQSLYNEQDMQKIRQTKAEVFVINGNTLDAFEDQLMMLGRLIGKELDYSKYVDKISQQVLTAKSTASTPALKVAVIMPDTGHSHMIAGSSSFIADVLKKCGLAPIGPSGEMYVPLNAEFLISQNPDVIITSGSADPLLSDPRLASMNAIKDRKVISIVGDVLLRRGGRVDKLIEGINKGILSLDPKKAS